MQAPWVKQIPGDNLIDLSPLWHQDIKKEESDATCPWRSPGVLVFSIFILVLSFFTLRGRDLDPWRSGRGKDGR
jgi:hypothetical protein